ncbi:hypothetical protein [Clostridium sp. UBA6640]|uniref:hypothetical protein n=1 Tax=Clostridium sp. UBA6640 TaxID=1946370 RepID=UPI0025C42AA5|nr:hypothetical protein [Clostridium sp. UBA6640]
MGGIIVLVIISLFLCFGIHESRKIRTQKNNMYKVLGINKRDVKCNHKFLVAYGINSDINTKCTLILHTDYVFIILPTINYRISKEQLIGASLFTNDELVQRKNTESSLEHRIGVSTYGRQTEAILDALRPATKTVKIKMNYMLISFNSNEGQEESIILAPETDSDNNFIRLTVGAFNAVYKTKPKPINSEAISSETVDL